ncbi:permease-like cell division protein FtsX [Porticoccus sp. W117]|uniref:permease-like cell division protein FtsX n=1 Tax=Porticoccus sp. W117 TaxID=3054777 RepID=UPI0025920B2C|nr:permease-like cell division protein FtsX [Porticoccus sp. W117]MDM3870864.1 permease-like cell division protein FtsX [Porticoccus sp. W117]
MSTSNDNAGQRHRGARESRTGIGARLQGWLNHHRDSAISAWRKMREMPLQATMTTLVIAIALALPAALYAVVNNLQQVSDGIESSAQMSLYLEHGSSISAANKLQLQLKTRPLVTRTQLVSAEDALQEFQSHSGLGSALSQLDENPLPHVLVLEFDQAAVSPEQLSATADELQQLPLVDSVRLDMQWVQRLHAILEMGRQVAFALGIALALGVLLVIGNTIRLAVENRRDEIVVVKLVGGTNGYVRRPFLYTGLWYGLAGGLLGWLLVCAGLLWLGASVAHLSALYESGFQVVILGPTELAALLVGGGGLGLVGAWLAVGRHLGDIEPN